VSGIVGLTIGDLFGFTSLRILGARRQSVVSTVAPAATAVAGFFLLDERLSLLRLAGMGLSIAGVMYAMGSAEERSDVHREGFGSYTAGIALAIGGAVCQGAGLVLAKIGLQADGGNVAPFHATFMRMSVGFAATYVLDVIRRAPHRPLREAFTDAEGTRAMAAGTFFGPITGVTLPHRGFASANGDRADHLLPCSVRGDGHRNDRPSRTASHSLRHRRRCGRCGDRHPRSLSQQATTFTVSFVINVDTTFITIAPSHAPYPCLPWSARPSRRSERACRTDG
jgi:hypothetical protein